MLINARHAGELRLAHTVLFKNVSARRQYWRKIFSSECLVWSSDNWLHHLTIDNEYFWKVLLAVPYDMWRLRYVFPSITLTRCFTFTHTCVVSAYPLTLAWLANSIPRPPAKRSAAIGLANGFGNLGTLYVVIVSPSICFIDDLLTARGLIFGDQAGAPSITSRWLLESVDLHLRVPSVWVCVSFQLDVLHSNTDGTR